MFKNIGKCSVVSQLKEQGGLNMVSGKLLDTSLWNTLFVFWVILCVTGIILTVICSDINKRGKFNQA